MKKITYTPTGGVCSRQIDIEIEGGIVHKVTFTGGCNGNAQGVARLVAGMTTAQVVERLHGINCKGKGTSCPDQLALAILESENKN